MLEKLFSNDNLKLRIFRHLIFWSFVYAYLFFTATIGDLNVKDFLIANLKYLFATIPFIYFLIYFILPRFLIKKKYTTFFLFYFILMFINDEIIRSFYYSNLCSIFFHKDFPNNILNFDWDLIKLKEYSVYSAISYSKFIVISTPPVLTKVLKYWHNTIVMNKELEKKNLEHRMELLRSQIHPHFLFNTLNNLYSLAVDQSKKVPEIIIKISNILRYMLKEYNKKVVSLSEELDIIFTYIELEKLRYGEQLNIEINNEVKEIYQSIIKGPPLVLFTFVENAFKHGPGKSINNSWIKIDIKYIYGELIFKVENNKEEIESNHRNNQNGLGLKNAKTTLDLYFHNKYKLDILKNQDSFKIELKINYKNEN